MFVTQAINSLLTVSKSTKGDQPIGVCLLKRDDIVNKYFSTIRYHNVVQRLGFYSNATDAHRAWVKRKREIIAEVITKQDDQRLIDGLLLRLDMLDHALENNHEIISL